MQSKDRHRRTHRQIHRELQKEIDTRANTQADARGQTNRHAHASKQKKDADDVDTPSIICVNPKSVTCQLLSLDALRKKNARNDRAPTSGRASKTILKARDAYM